MFLSSLNRSPEARGSSLSTCDQHHQHSSNSIISINITIIISINIVIITIITLNLVHDKASDHPSNNSEAKCDQDCQELAQCLLVVIVMMKVVSVTMMTMIMKPSFIMSASNIMMDMGPVSVPPG